MTLEELRAWVDELPVSEDVKQRMRAPRPADYIGLAPQVCSRVLDRARAWLDR